MPIEGWTIKVTHYREKTEIRAMQTTRDLLKNKGSRSGGGSTTGISGLGSSTRRDSDTSIGRP